MATKKDNLEVVETTEYKSVHARLIEAKKGFGKAGKTADNPHLKSKYADLSSVLEAVTDSLNDAGLYLHQVVVEAGLHTSIVSCDGDSIDFGTMPILASKQDAQGYGSGLTYARRYSIMNACGIAPEDDDGAKAVETYKAPPKQAPQQAQPSPQDAKLLDSIRATIADMQKLHQVEPSFWGARYGKPRAQMTNDELNFVDAELRYILASFNDGNDKIEPFGGFQ
jgi:hypothetical protein